MITVVEFLKMARDLTLLFVNPFLRISQVSSIRHDGYTDGLKNRFLGGRLVVNAAKFLGL